MTDIPLPWETAIRNAIARRAEIEFTLGGQPMDMQPHILFVTRTGDRLLRGVRFGTGWIEVPIDQVKDLAVRRNLTFEPDPGFDSGDPRYYDIRATI
jgi:hypothetical protein